VTLREGLEHPWLTVRVQIAVGCIFIAAALPKVIDPPSFAHMVYNYRIVPGSLVNLFALVLPWVELLSGVALVLGLWRRTAAIILGGLLVAFVAGISINLLRHNPIDCGCFDVHAAGKTTAERLSDMRLVILRDFGILLLVAQTLWAGRRPERPAALVAQGSGAPGA
jgi:uncharacterized membrane protein YphA (DoxX/SURF4 family)